MTKYIVKTQDPITMKRETLEVEAESFAVQNDFLYFRRSVEGNETSFVRLISASIVQDVSVEEPDRT